MGGAGGTGLHADELYCSALGTVGGVWADISSSRLVYGKAPHAAGTER